MILKKVFIIILCREFGPLRPEVFHPVLRKQAVILKIQHTICVEITFSFRLLCLVKEVRVFGDLGEVRVFLEEAFGDGLFEAGEEVFELECIGQFGTLVVIIGDDGVGFTAVGKDFNPFKDFLQLFG